MKHPKFLVEVLTKTSMRFLEKNAPGVEVLTRTYLRSLVRTYFMKQGSAPLIRKGLFISLGLCRIQVLRSVCPLSPTFHFLGISRYISDPKGLQLRLIDLRNLEPA